MTEAIQEFCYLSTSQIKKLSKKKWHCTTCLESNLKRPIISHCGIKHAFHRDCEIEWLKEHGVCSLCRQPVKWNAILSWSESFFASLPIRAGVKISSIVYHQVESSPHWRLFYTGTLTFLGGYLQEIPLIQSLGAFTLMKTFGNLANESSSSLEEFSKYQKNLQDRIKEFKNTKKTLEEELKKLKEKKVKPNRKGRKLEKQIEERENRLQQIQSECPRMERIYREQKNVLTLIWFAHKAQYTAQCVSGTTGLYFFYFKSF